MRFQDRTVVITGANHGIGRACAHLFAREGANVVFTDADKKKGTAAVKAICKEGNDASFVPCNVSDRVQVDAMVKRADAEYEGIDVVINNAASVHHGEFLEMDEDDFDRVVHSNLKGIFLVGQAAAKRMVRRVQAGGEAGVIVNIAAVSHMSTVSGQVPDIVSRGGLAQMTEVMAASLAPHGIRVNGIGPGNILTEYEGRVMSEREAFDRAAGNAPLGRPGNPEEIANIAAFLASNDSAYLTGQTLYPDGGRAARYDVT